MESNHQEMKIDYKYVMIDIRTPEKKFFYIEGKTQSLEEYLFPRLRPIESAIALNLDLLDSLNKPGKIYVESKLGDVCFDTDLCEDNIIGYFRGITVTSSYPKLINPKIVLEKLIKYVHYSPEEKEAIKNKYNENNPYMDAYPSPNSDSADFMYYIDTAKFRKEDEESINNNYTYYQFLNLKKSYYDYLKQFRIV